MSRKKIAIEIKNINNRIKEIRKALKISQHEFARLTGVSQGYISELESGKKNAGIELIISLKRLNVSYNWLFTGEGEMFPETGRVVKIKDIPRENIKAWIDELWEKAPEKERTWFEVHFQKCFPEYVEWLKKKETESTSGLPEADKKLNAE